jgi:general secretion pathway protein A
MYEEFFAHFGLQRNPFHVSPDPKQFYSTTTHDEALLQLVFGIESRKGLMVLTGEPGTGKSTILRYLLEWLEQYKYSTAYVYHTLLSSMDLLQLILRDFGIASDSRDKNELLDALKKWLVKRHAAGDCPVIIVDESQLLKSQVLDTLRTLLNQEVRGAKLVQLILAGQPQFEEKLHDRKLAKLRDKIYCHCRLRPLTLGETSGYIAARLKGAGANGAASFPEEVVAEIQRYSNGIPRVVNLFCEHSLLAAYADRRAAIRRSDVMRVAQQFDFAEEGIQETAETYDTFSRLIPFPEPSATETGERPVVEAFDEAAAMDAKAWIRGADAIESAPTTEAGVATEEAMEMPVAKANRGWAHYCRGVAKSFVRDGQEFAVQCATWLRKPVRQAGSWTSSFARGISVIYSWLRLPLGSTKVSGGSQ